jgi:hypothetical protein
MGVSHISVLSANPEPSEDHLMPRNTRVADALVRMMTEYSEELTAKARSERLLGIGQKVRVTLEIVDETPVEITFSEGQEKLATESDWAELMALPWNASKRGGQILPTLEEMQRSPNRELLLHMQDAHKVNAYLSYLRTPFKLKSVRSGPRSYRNYYGLFRRTNSIPNTNGGSA